jgi:hypothetical protein
VGAAGRFAPGRLAEAELVARTRLFLLVFSALASQAATAAWSTRAPDESNLDPIAYITNDAGLRAEIFLGDQNAVYLRLVLGEGFETFAATNCPTFQIDKRKPMHHFDIGPRCAMVDKKATFLLGRIADREIKSLILHRFMNGDRVTFRYTVKTGQYRQTSFSLSRSKQALKQALGFDTRIRVD